MFLFIFILTLPLEMYFFYRKLYKSFLKVGEKMHSFICSFILLNQPVNGWGFILCQERVLPIHHLIDLSHQPVRSFTLFYM